MVSSEWELHHLKEMIEGICFDDDPATRKLPHEDRIKYKIRSLRRDIKQRSERIQKLHQLLDIRNRRIKDLEWQLASAQAKYNMKNNEQFQKKQKECNNGKCTESSSLNETHDSLG